MNFYKKFIIALLAFSMIFTNAATYVLADNNKIDIKIKQTDKIKATKITLTSSKNEFVFDRNTKSVTICFYAEVDGDAEDVMLYAAGKTSALALMKDDGQYRASGDDLESDNIYSCKLIFGDFKEEALLFYAAAKGARDLNSDTLTINSIAALTDAEKADIRRVDEAMSELRDGDEYMEAGFAERRDMAAAKLGDLESRGLIRPGTVECREDDNMVVFAYSCGILGGEMLEELDGDFDGIVRYFELDGVITVHEYDDGLGDDGNGAYGGDVSKSSAESKAADTKVAETKPVESKAAETKSVESKQAEAKSVESKPGEVKSVESKPAASGAVPSIKDSVSGTSVESKPANPSSADSDVKSGAAATSTKSGAASTGSGTKSSSATADTKTPASTGAGKTAAGSSVKGNAAASGVKSNPAASGVKTPASSGTGNSTAGTGAKNIPAGVGVKNRTDEYNTGIRTGDYKYGTKIVKNTTNSALEDQSASVRNYAPAIGAYEASDGAMASNSGIGAGAIVDAGKSAVILFSYNLDSDDVARRLPFYQDAQAEWKSRGLATTLVTNVTIPDFKRLGGYDVIVIAGHGTTYAGLPVTILSETPSDANLAEYSADLKMHRIACVGIVGNGSRYVVFSKMIGDAYHAKDLAGSLVFSESCEMAGRNGMISDKWHDAFGSKSASSFVAVNNTIRAEYCRNFMKSWVDGLIDGETAAASFRDAAAEYGANDGQPAPYKAVPHLFGDRDALLIDNLANGLYELDSSPQYWKTVGDTRIIQKLGGLYPTEGSKMAFISTGIGSSSGGPQVFYDGTRGSFIQQTFMVPENASLLEFDYNMVSEEPSFIYQYKDYRGSEFNDAFIGEIIQGDGTKIRILNESVNGSDWIAAPLEKVKLTIGQDGGRPPYQTGWQKGSADLTPYQNTVITIRFTVFDRGDRAYDTVGLVDNFVIK